MGPTDHTDEAPQIYIGGGFLAQIAFGPAVPVLQFYGML
jgi:hypothetical protein